ncbi:MAG: glycosyltransferase family 4 protein [Gemmatimonadota bacterium]|nr:glycosyltransferase family 4 protein [Gemmatimonadota bacterium]
MSGALRLLLLNWQDRENPEAGGAELHLHEIFGRLARRGHELRAVVSGWRGAEPETSLDGILFRRVGGRFDFPLRGVPVARRLLTSWKADLVIEDINKIPLYAPLWAGRPVVGLVPHLFGTTAFREASWPLAALVWCAERGIPRAYRSCPFQAISESTAGDLERRGIDRGRIRVIPPGIDHGRYTPGARSDRAARPTVLYLGRLKRYKGLDILLRAMARLRASGLRGDLVIAGRGDDRARLERLGGELELGDRVRFLGHVDEDEKLRWLRRAWVLAYPSPKEGWGLAVVEAAACGTPVIASDSPGLRESVLAGESGLLVPHDDVQAWSRALEDLLGSPDLRDHLAKGGIAHAATFSWDRAARQTEAHLRTILNEESREPRADG